MPQNIILIGMPGSGKSTIGVQLAKHLGLHFVDSDILIQTEQNQTLQSIMDEHGYLALRQIEEDILATLTLDNTLLSTGGSAVYSDRAMQNLKQQGTIVYLSVSYPEIKRRINNEDDRGIARPAGQSMEDVYNERRPLYEKYADVTIVNEQAITMAEITHKILRNT